MASRKVSPKGIGSATRMVQFFISALEMQLGSQSSPIRRSRLRRHDFVNV
jgi:hypothetical protein